MRGKAGKRILQLEAAGITPAYAGKSSILTVFAWCCQDHPRLCGEKATSASQQIPG